MIYAEIKAHNPPPPQSFQPIGALAALILARQPRDRVDNPETAELE